MPNKNIEEKVEELLEYNQAFWELPETNGSEILTMIEADRREKVALYCQEKLERSLRQALLSVRNEALLEAEEEVRKAFDYPCSCMARQEMCGHDFTEVKSFISVLASLRNNKE